MFLLSSLRRDLSAEKFFFTKPERIEKQLRSYISLKEKIGEPVGFMTPTLSIDNNNSNDYISISMENPENLRFKRLVDLLEDTIIKHMVKESKYFFRGKEIDLETLKSSLIPFSGQILVDGDLESQYGQSLSVEQFNTEASKTVLALQLESIRFYPNNTFNIQLVCKKGKGFIIPKINTNEINFDADDIDASLIILPSEITDTKKEESSSDDDDDQSKEEEDEEEEHENDEEYNEPTI